MNDSVNCLVITLSFGYSLLDKDLMHQKVFHLRAWPWLSLLAVCRWDHGIHVLGDPCQDRSGNRTNTGCSSTLRYQSNLVCSTYTFTNNKTCGDVLVNQRLNGSYQRQTLLESDLKYSLSSFDRITRFFLDKSIFHIKMWAPYNIPPMTITPAGESLIQKLKNNHDIVTQCRHNARKMFCHLKFPFCNGSRILLLCQEACHQVKEQKCKDILALEKSLGLHLFLDNIECHLLPSKNSSTENCFFPGFLVTGTSTPTVTNPVITSKTTEDTTTYRVTTTKILESTTNGHPTTPFSTPRTPDRNRNITTYFPLKATSNPISIPSTRTVNNGTTNYPKTTKTFQPTVSNYTSSLSRISTTAESIITTPSFNICIKYSYVFKSRPESICRYLLANDHLYHWKNWKNSDYLESDRGLERAFEMMVPIARPILGQALDKGVVNAIKPFVDVPEFAKEFENVTIPTREHYNNCAIVARDYACYENFETCDYSGRLPMPKYLCREACEFIQNGVCKEEITLARLIDDLKKKYPAAFKLNVYVINIKYCNSYQMKRPGNAHTCMIPDYFLAPEMKKNTTETCYENSGYRYRGDINTTTSGYSCQHWSGQSPHEHRFYTGKFPELIKAENKCRNPRGFGERPWCFTLNSSTRWEYCKVPHCPVNGVYRNWSEFGPCNATCGGGFQFRTRSCTSSQHGGRNCSSFGPEFEMKYCLKPCPVNGNYSEWLDGECNATCGNNSFKNQYRECSNPKPMFNGKNCSHLGPSIRLIKCDTPTCKISSNDGLSVILWSLFGVLGVSTTFALFVAFIRNRETARKLCIKTNTGQDDDNMDMEEAYYIRPFTAEHIAKVMRGTNENIANVATPPMVCKQNYRNNNISKENIPPPLSDSLERPKFSSAPMDTINNSNVSDIVEMEILVENKPLGQTELILMNPNASSITRL